MGSGPSFLNLGATVISPVHFKILLSLPSTHKMPVALLRCDNGKCLQMSPNVLGKGTKLPLIEKHYSKTWLVPMVWAILDYFTCVCIGPDVF